MSEQYDEHEQSERVKQWLLKNGSNILTGVLLAVSAVAGWQWWQGRQANQGQEAANQYQVFVQSIEKKDAAKAAVLGDAFIKNYADTDLAFLASLRLAKLHLDDGKPELAAKVLESAQSLAHGKQNLELIKIRKAQLAQAQARWDDATAMLDSFKPEFYQATYEEMRGDIALAKNQREQAAKHFQSALAKLDPTASSRALIEMKLSEAGGSAAGTSEIR
jgi:predicted negative regulator of RcsB-dependent stress response